MIATTDLVRELIYQIRLGEDSAYEFKSISLKGNKVETINYNGSTMWPEDVWMAKQKQRKIVE